MVLWQEKCSIIVKVPVEKDQFTKIAVTFERVIFGGNFLTAQQ